MRGCAKPLGCESILNLAPDDVPLVGTVTDFAALACKSRIREERRRIGLPRGCDPDCGTGVLLSPGDNSAGMDED